MGVKKGEGLGPAKVVRQRSCHDKRNSEKLKEDTERKEAFNRQMMKEEPAQMEKNDPVKPEPPCWNNSSNAESDCKFMQKIRELKEIENKGSQEKDNREEEEEEEGKLSLESIGDRIGSYLPSPLVQRDWKSSPFDSLASRHISGQSIGYSLQDTRNLCRQVELQSSGHVTHDKKQIETDTSYDMESLDKEYRDLENKLTIKMKGLEKAGLPGWAYYQESQIDKGSQFTTGMEAPKYPGLQSGENEGLVGEFGLQFGVTYLQYKASLEKTFRQMSPKRQAVAMENLQKCSKIVGMMKKLRNTEQKSFPNNGKDRLRNTEQKSVTKNEKDKRNQTKKKRKLMDPDPNTHEKKDLKSEKDLKYTAKEEMKKEKVAEDCSPAKEGPLDKEQVKDNKMMVVDDAAEESRLPQVLTELESQSAKEAANQEWAKGLKGATIKEMSVDRDACILSHHDTSVNESHLQTAANVAPTDKDPRPGKGSSNSINSDTIQAGCVEEVPAANQEKQPFDLTEDVATAGGCCQEPLDLTEDVPMAGQGDQGPLDLTENVQSTSQDEQTQGNGLHNFSQGNIPYCKSNTFTLCSEEAPTTDDPLALPEELDDTSLSTLPRPTPFDNNWQTFLLQCDQPEGPWWCLDSNDGHWVKTLAQGSDQGRKCSGRSSSGRGGSYGGSFGGGNGSQHGGRSGGTGSGGREGDQGSGSWQGQGSGDGDDPYRGKPGTKKKKVEEVQDEDEDKDKDESEVQDGEEEDGGPSGMKSGPKRSLGYDQHGQLEMDKMEMVLGLLHVSVDEGGGDASSSDMMEGLQQLNMCLLYCLQPGKQEVQCHICATVSGLLRHFAKDSDQACSGCQKVIKLLEFHIDECMKMNNGEMKCCQGQVLCEKIQKKLRSGTAKKTSSKLFKNSAVWFKIQKYLMRLLGQRESLSPAIKENVDDICPSFTSIMSIQNQSLRSVMGLPFRPSPGMEGLGSMTSLTSGQQDSVFGSGMDTGQEPRPVAVGPRTGSLGGVRPKTRLSYRPSDPARIYKQLSNIMEHDHADAPGEPEMDDTQENVDFVNRSLVQPVHSRMEPRGPERPTFGGEDISKKLQSMSIVGQGMGPQMMQSGAGLTSLRYSSMGVRPMQQQDRYGSVPAMSAGVAQGLRGHRQVDYGDRTDLRIICRHWMREKDRDGPRPKCEEGVLLEQSDDARKGMSIESGRYQKDFQWQPGVYLGTGMTGKCHMATDLNTGFQFCVKKMDMQKFDIGELEIWSDLQDPHIVQLYGAIRDGEKIYIFAECVYGGSLQDFIEAQGRLNTIMALNYLQQLLHVLVYLKQKRVLHEDLKGDNILLRAGTFELVVIDFGVSTRLGPDGAVGRGASPVGGPTQWSPEKATSEVYSYNSDVWACVCLLVHMLSGHPVWFRRYPNVGSLMFVIGTKSPPMEDIPADIPEDVRDLILQGWTIDPVRRPSAEQLLNHRAFDRLRQSNHMRNVEQGSRVSSLPLLPSHQVYTSLGPAINSLRSLRPSQGTSASMREEMCNYQQIIQDMDSLRQRLKAKETARQGEVSKPIVPNTSGKGEENGPSLTQKHNPISVQEQSPDEPHSDSFELPENMDITEYDFSESLKEQLGPEVLLPDASLQWQASYIDQHSPEPRLELPGAETEGAVGGTTVPIVELEGAVGGTTVPSVEPEGAVGGATAREVPQSHLGVSFLLPALSIFDEEDSDNDDDFHINVPAVAENMEETDVMTVAVDDQTQRHGSPQRQRPVLPPLQMPHPPSGGARPKEYPKTAPVKSPGSADRRMHRSETMPGSLESMRKKSQDRSADRSADEELDFYTKELLMMNPENLENQEELVQNLGTSPLDGSYYSSTSAGNMSQDGFGSDHNITSSASSSEVGHSEPLDEQTLEESRKRLIQGEGSPRSQGLRVEFHDLTLNGPVLKSFRILSGGELWKEVVTSVCHEINQKYRSFNVKNSDGTLLDLNRVPGSNDIVRGGADDVVHVIVMPVDEATEVNGNNNPQWQSWRAVDGDIETF